MAVSKEKEHSEIIDWTCSSIEAYVYTLKHHLFNSRMYIVKILDLVSRHAKYDANSELHVAFQSAFQDSQVWVWLFWMPQLLDFIPRSNSEYEVAKLVLSELAKLYPQPVFMTLRTFFWYFGSISKRDSDLRNKANELGRVLFSLLNDKHHTYSYTIKDVIDLVVIELQKRFQVTKEEELHGILEMGYTTSLREDFKPDKYLTLMWMQFFKKESEGSDFIKTTLRAQFIKDFTEGDAEEVKIVNKPFPYYQEKLKKWKDILSRRLSLKFSPQNLVEISKKLANFNYRLGVELPGQFLEIDIEPFPEKRILITKFEPNISQNYKNYPRKRIIIRTNTGKRLTYYVTYHPKTQEHLTKTDEIITQFKVFMNKIFTNMNTETMRRGIKFGVFKKVTFPFTKLCENNNLNSLDEIYKVACSEYGIDPDTATCLFTRDLKEILKKKGQDHVLSSDEINQKIKECNQYMRQLIEANYLSKHFRNILKTADDYFMYRKQFSNYFASNSFLTYAFKLNENTHQNIKICERQGRVFHSECKIKFNKTKSSLENPDEMVQAISDIKERTNKFDDINNVPFRLSDNIKEFITDIGLDTIFPGVMTCCSLATQHKKTYIKSFLRLFFLQCESQVFNNKESNFLIDNLTEDVLQRMLSLAKPYFDKDVSQMSYLADEENKEVREATIKMANMSLEKERFNKLAYDLVQELAGNKEVLNEMHPCFTSWF